MPPAPVRRPRGRGQSARAPLDVQGSQAESCRPRAGLPLAVPARPQTRRDPRLRIATHRPTVTGPPSGSPLFAGERVGEEVREPFLSPLARRPVVSDLLVA